MLVKNWDKRLATIVLTLMAMLFISGSSIAMIDLGFVQSAWADASTESNSMVEGAVLFETHCAGCHPKGGNIIKRGKTLKLKPLTRRHLDSEAAIASLVTQGKGLMSAYGETLTLEEINTVSTYVWEQAQTNWKPRT